MKIRTKDGQLAAEYTDGWVFHSEELEERYDGLEVYGFVGAPKVDGVDIIEIGGELPEDDYRFAYDLAGDDYVVSLNGSVEKGSAASGHRGHGGRPGRRGGSAAKGTVSVEEHHERAGAWESKLSSAEKRAVDTYVSYGYNTINGWLRETDGRLGPITDMDARRNIRSLDSALKRAPELDRDIVLYRGVEEIADTPLGTLKAGDRFDAPAYVSTSIHSEEAAKFTGGSGKLLVINVPEGTRNVGFVSGGTSDEVILPRRTSESGFNNSMFVREVTADRMVVDFLPSRTTKGGPGSGHHGHGGRPGSRGGSASVASAGAGPTEDVEQYSWGRHTILEIGADQKLPSKFLKTDAAILIHPDRTVTMVAGRLANNKFHADLAYEAGRSTEEFDRAGRWTTYVQADGHRAFLINTESTGIRGRSRDTIAADAFAEKQIVKQAAVLRRLGYPTDSKVFWLTAASHEPIGGTLDSWKAETEHVIVTTLGELLSKGGAGSGHHGHAGRQGLTGGSSALPGYVARTTAMQELGVKHASRMNQYFKYGMPSTSVGGRRYVKWPEAKEWMDQYSGAGKGTRGVEAANTAMRSRGIPVGKHPPLPPPPPPSKPVTGRYAMDQLGIKHYSRLHSYKKHGMPTMKDPKTGKDVIKWPEAKLWYETYEKSGKGRAGIDAANKAVNSTGAKVPKPPAPPKPPGPTPEPPTTGEGKYEGVKVYANSKEKISDVEHVKTKGFGPNDVGNNSELKIVKRSIGRLPQEHVDTVRMIETQTISEANRLYGAGWGDNVAAWMDRSGRMGLIYDDRGSSMGSRRVWDRGSVVHEVGHGVFVSMATSIGRKNSRQNSARKFFGDTNSERSKKKNRINKEYKAAKAGKKGKGFVTGYSRKNSEEFFCENYAHYVTKPGKLYQTNKSMYNFLKTDVFGGMEYSDLSFNATVK